VSAVRWEQGRTIFADPALGEVRAVETGPTTVEFGRLDAGIDSTPLFRGLPDDMCQANHVGYVLRGRMTWRTPEGEFETRAGEAIVVGPRHIPVVADEGCEWVLFTAPEEYALTAEAVVRNRPAHQSSEENVGHGQGPGADARAT
jgi:hypothetical protein